MLTVTADGAVPIAFRVADGNTADVTTHIDTWDSLVALTGRTDFLYTADSKLASFDNVAHIHSRGGRLSVLPVSRKEDGVFRDWVVTNTCEWTEAQRRPTSDADHPEDVLSTYQDHLPSADGHRIIWIHSTAKARRDATRRHQAIARAIAAIDALNIRLSSPRCRIKTAFAAEAEAREAIAELHATRWVNLHVEADTVESFRQAKRGRPGPNTAYIKIVTTRLRIRFTVDEHQVAHDAASDGMWPLITNERGWWWCGRRASRAAARSGWPTSSIPTAPSWSNASGPVVCAPTITTPTGWCLPWTASGSRRLMSCRPRSSMVFPTVRPGSTRSARGSRVAANVRTLPSGQGDGGSLRADGRGLSRSTPWCRADTLVAVGLGVLLAFLFLATATTGPAQVNDTRAASIGAWALGTQGSVLLPADWPQSHNYWGVEGRNDRVLVNRFPGVAYWASPAYTVAAHLGDQEPAAHPFLVPAVPASITAALTAAAVAVALFVLLRGVVSRPVALAGTVAVATGTSLWSVAADALWPHAPAMLALTGTLLAWRRSHPGLAAACATVAVLVRPHLIVVVLVLALFAWRRERIRDSLALGGGALAGVVLLSVYSAWAFGTLLPIAGYDAPGHLGGLLHHSPWQTIRGLGLALISPSHGLLVYSPVLVPALVGLAAFWRRLPPWTLASALTGLLYLLVQMRAVGHTGGEGFFAYRTTLEPLILAAPALVLATAIAVRYPWQRTMLAALAAISIGVHGYGAVVGGIDDDTTRTWHNIHVAVRDSNAPTQP